MDRPKRAGGLAFSAALLASAGAITSILQLLLNIVLARTLSKAGLGTYKQVHLLYGIAAPFFTLALPASLLYLMPRLDEKRRRVLGLQTIQVLFLFGLAFGFLLVISASFWAQSFRNPDLTAQLRLFAALPLLALPASVASSLGVALGRSRLVAGLSIVTGTSGFIITVATAIVTGSLRAVVLASVVASAVNAAVVLPIAWSWLGGFRLVGFDRQLLHEQFAYTIPLALSGLAGLLAYQTDRLIVSTAFSPADFAIYALGAVEVPLIAVIIQSVNAVLTPRISELFAQQRFNEIVDLYREAVRKSAVVILPFFGYLFFLAFEFFAFLYPGYEQSVPLFRIYLLMVPLRVATYGLILQATGKTRSILYGSVAYLFANAALSLALVRLIGLSGPAWGTVVTTVGAAIYYLRGSALRVRSTMVRLLPLTTIGMLIVVSATVGKATSIIFERLNQSAGVTLALGAPVYALGYLSLGYALRAITKDDVSRLLRGARKILSFGRRGPESQEGTGSWSSGEETTLLSTTDSIGNDSPSSRTLL